MTAPLSSDFRLRVVKAIEGGLSRRAAAAKFEVSIASAVRWYQRFKRTGSIEPDAIGGDHHSHRAGGPCRQDFWSGLTNSVI